MLFNLLLPNALKNRFRTAFWMMTTCLKGKNVILSQGLKHLPKNSHPQGTSHTRHDVVRTFCQWSRSKVTGRYKKAKGCGREKRPHAIFQFQNRRLGGLLHNPIAFHPPQMGRQTICLELCKKNTEYHNVIWICFKKYFAFTKSLISWLWTSSVWVCDKDIVKCLN